MFLHARWSSGCGRYPLAIDPESRSETKPAESINFPGPEKIRTHFVKARERLKARAAALATAGPDDDGPRRGTLEFQRSQTAWLEDVIRYRLGEAVDSRASEQNELPAAVLAARRGEVPEPSEFVDERAIELVRRTFAKDLSALRRHMYSNNPSFVLGMFVAAVAPRIRPAPTELLDWIETPRWSLRLISPGALAWDAAGRRDVLRALGEPERAARWESIARRQWQIASRPEMAVCLSMLSFLLP